MDPTALDRQKRRLDRLKSEGVYRSTVFVHQECREALDSLRPMFLNPTQGTLIQQVVAQMQKKTAPTNVAQVTQLSPFRYPGGKTWLVPELRRWLTVQNPISTFVEPFAGGASCALMVASESLAERVVLGELDMDVAAVWLTIFDSPPADAKWLCRQILEFDVTEVGVRAALATVPRNNRDRAWKTIVRNRMQRGGILAPGAGLIKSGEAGRGLASRWYPQTLVRRIECLQLLRNRVKVFAGDAFDLMAQHSGDKRAAFLIDPPYTAGGKSAGTRLYNHHALDHDRLFRVSANIKGTVMMTYDDAPEVRTLAEKYGFAISQVPMKSGHHEVHKELLLTRL